RAARRRAPDLDEAHWRRTEPAVSVGGQVSLGGLAPLVVAQVLYGLQQRCRMERVQTKEADLRGVCDDLRRQQVGGIGDYVLDERRCLGFVGLVRSLGPMPAGPWPPPRPRSPATNGTWRCSGIPARSRSWRSVSAGSGRRPSGGRPTTCPGAGSGRGGTPAAAWPSVTT